MAAGVTETEVHAAADAIVARRERPTIERIRAELGRGSPNTVNRHLDTWWAMLSGRLDSGSAGDVPAEIVELAAKIWKQVLPKASQLAADQLTEARAALEVRATEVDAQLQAVDRQRQELAGARIALDQRIGELEAALKASERSASDLRESAGQQAKELRDANREIQRLSAAAGKSDAAHAIEVAKLTERLAGNEKRLMERLTTEIEGRQRDRQSAEKQARRLEEQLQKSQAQLLAQSNAAIEVQAGVRTELDSLRKAVSAGGAAKRIRSQKAVRRR